MNTKVELTINGQEVEGEITHRSATDIDVEITQPYQGISTGLHIPYAARPFKSFETELGDTIAKDLLKEIYSICTFISTNLDSLTEEYLQVKKRIKYLEAKSVSEWVFKSKRFQLRKLLRSGQIDNIEYQKRLTPLTKEYRKLRLKIYPIWSRFIEENFPMVVTAGIRNDVLRFLEKNIRATNKEVEANDFKSSGSKMIMSKRVLLGNAYFIHPHEGQVIYVPHSHISLVISNPEKFRLNFDYIKTIYEKYGEKIGLEGRARREILLDLIDQGFIRIRKYKNHWKVNVKDLYMNAAAKFLYRWAKPMIGATNDFHIEVIIEQKNGEVIKTDLKTLSSYQFAGRPKNRIQAMSYMPGPFLMIDEVELGPFLP
jgi:hypothetical protein